MTKLIIRGGDELMAKLKRVKGGFDRAFQSAAMESGSEIINTRGLKKYPPATAANAPGRTRTVQFGERTVVFRSPYYIRGRGLMIPTRGGGWRLIASTQRYGTQWATTRITGGAKVINRAGYAIHLAGDERPAWAGNIGWRKIKDVAVEKAGKIKQIFAAHFEKLLRAEKLK